jgi:hypothetical protein
MSSCNNSVCIPSEWTSPHKDAIAETEDQELIAMNDLLRWVNETRLTTEEGAKIVFKRINAYRYLRCLYPIAPVDPTSLKIFQLNLHFLVLGYIIDDKIEKYNMSDMNELITGYNELQNQVSQMLPKFPSISGMKRSLGNIKNDFSKSAIATIVDFMNKSTLILLEGGKIPEDNVVGYRKRLSKSVALYLDALLSKTKTGCEISENEMLWRRCFDALALPVYMSTEVFSDTLVKNRVLPISEFYKFYFLSILFCIVINDLYSYERDKLEDADSIIKVWYQNKTVTDIKTATSNIAKILEAIVQQMYSLVEGGKAKHPDLTEWFERVASMTVGWIYIHNTVVPRYVSSPHQVTLIEIEKSMVANWLLEKDEYGQMVVQEFLENLTNPSERHPNVADMLCA